VAKIALKSRLNAFCKKSDSTIYTKTREIEANRHKQTQKEDIGSQNDDIPGSTTIQ